MTGMYSDAKQENSFHIHCGYAGLIGEVAALLCTSTEC